MSSDLIRMNVFDNTQNSDKVDGLPKFNGSTEQDMLDYMVLVLSRCMSCAMAFKGGYMLNQLLGGASRRTADIDFSIAYKGDYASVKDWLQKIAEKFIELNLITSYKVKEDIQERQSGGIDMFDSTGRKMLGVDVGLHNIGYGIRHYDLGFTDVDGFSIERMLSDKIIAITTRKRFRRTKDLYDVYAITNFFDVDCRKLAEYVELRGGAEWDNIPFNDDVILQYKHAWDKLDLRSFVNSGSLEKPVFEDALNRFYELALPLKMGHTNFKWEYKNGRRIPV